MGLERTLRDEIKMAALLHDTGKIGLSDRLLAKGRMLDSSDEIREYQSHSVRGQSAFGKIEEFQQIGLYIRHHHEAYDGSGFPDGLAGRQIPLGAQIIAAANWNEAAFHRSNGPVTGARVAEKLAGQSGCLFDPVLLSAVTHEVTRTLAV